MGVSEGTGERGRLGASGCEVQMACWKIPNPRSSVVVANALLCPRSSENLASADSNQDSGSPSPWSPGVCFCSRRMRKAGRCSRSFCRPAASLERIMSGSEAVGTPKPSRSKTIFRFARSSYPLVPDGRKDRSKSPNRVVKIEDLDSAEESGIPAEGYSRGKAGYADCGLHFGQSLRKALQVFAQSKAGECRP